MPRMLSRSERRQCQRAFTEGRLSLRERKCSCHECFRGAKGDNARGPSLAVMISRNDFRSVPYRVDLNLFTLKYSREDGNVVSGKD